MLRKLATSLDTSFEDMLEVLGYIDNSRFGDNQSELSDYDKVVINDSLYSSNDPFVQIDNLSNINSYSDELNSKISKSLEAILCNLDSDTANKFLTLLDYFKNTEVGDK